MESINLRKDESELLNSLYDLLYEIKRVVKLESSNSIFNTNNIILRDSIIVDENVHKIRYKLKKVEGYRPMDEEDKSIINEIINELSGGEENKNKNVKSEYEIIMNCDNSDYIIYFKK